VELNREFDLGGVVIEESKALDSHRTRARRMSTGLLEIRFQFVGVLNDVPERSVLDMRRPQEESEDGHNLIDGTIVWGRSE